MNAKNLLCLICICTFIPENISINCGNERKCKTARVHGLRTSDCYRMDLKQFPKCLPSNIEVVELSYNRIKKISREDLQRYPYLAHLYLTDNFISKLNDETFRDLTNLETLDLSVNDIGKVPPAIFQLPYLKTLYLSQNKNINIAESIEEAKPISHSSLTKLDISYITEEDASTDFPDFGEFPLLAFLNITGDQFNYISTKHFAGLCNLQILISINVTAEYENDCDCWKINRWLTERNVKFTPLLCPTTERETLSLEMLLSISELNKLEWCLLVIHLLIWGQAKTIIVNMLYIINVTELFSSVLIDCLDQQIDDDDLEVFQMCREKFQKIERSILLNKIGLWIGVAVAAILIVAAIIGYRKWRKSKQQRESEKVRRDHLQLLNNQTKV